MRAIKPKTVLLALFAGLVTVLGSSAAVSQEPPAGTTLRGKPLAEALRQGGYVVYFRHAVTSANQADADQPDFARCESQRNLSDEGRRMAHEIGIAFKTLGIRFGKVVSSPYCRAADTAELAFGRHEVSPVLYFAVGVGKEERTRQSEKLRQMLHNANLKEATGIWPKKEGDAHVFRPGATGFVYVGKVTAEEWTRFAGASAAR